MLEGAVVFFCCGERAEAGKLREQEHGLGQRCPECRLKASRLANEMFSWKVNLWKERREYII